jgi:hypothetical protein
MSYESDLFISYAHLDNQPLVEGQKGWVEDFHRALAIRVGQLLGKEPQISRDQKLQGNDYFADTLIEQLRRVAVLVPILSPRYVKSEWTRRELAEFWRAATEQGGIRIGDKARVFKVLKTPVPLDMHPPEVQPLLGYEFFTVDAETGRVRSLEQVFGPEAQREFWMKLDDLAYDLCQILQTLEGGIRPTEPFAKTLPPAVYLAETTGDLKSARETIRRDLQLHGYRVLPSAPLPMVASELRTALAKELAECRLSIHLVGKHFSLVPEGGTESMIEIQNSMAVERAEKGGFSRLVWIPPNLDIADARQSALIDQLRMNPRAQKGADLLETSLEDLRTLVENRLKQSRPVADLPRRLTDAAELYLIYDQRDCEAIEPWRTFFFEQGLEVTHPLFEGDETEVRLAHEENLRFCDAALVFYGAANESWLRRKIREVQKSAAYGRKQALGSLAIVIAGPRTPLKEKFRTHEATVVPQWEGFSPDPLLPFVQQVKADKEALAG